MAISLVEPSKSNFSSSHSIDTSSDTFQEILLEILLEILPNDTFPENTSKDTSRDTLRDTFQRKHTITINLQFVLILRLSASISCKRASARSACGEVWKAAAARLNSGAGLLCL